MKKGSLLIKNIGRLVTMEEAKGRKGNLGVIEDAFVLIKDGLIVSFGKSSKLPKKIGHGYSELDADGATVTPGLIDCHTHLVHGGSRQNEFNQRSCGQSYWQIAQGGGGIMSTVRATRKATAEELYTQAYSKANEALRFGVTTLEAKSGYGLDTEAELKILRVIKKLQKNHPLDFQATFLGAHLVPTEYKDRRAKYVDLIIQEMLPAVVDQELSRYCDIFIEDGAFSLEEGYAIATAAKSYGLGIRLHVDQFKDDRGALLAAELEAVSADHLDHITDKSIEAMREAGVVGVVLPGATFFVSGRGYAPARQMIDHGMKVAISTDYNPGTNPCLNLLLTGTMAATQMDLTLDEVWRGITINAAASLEIEAECGSIAVGKKADLVLLAAPDEYYPLYRYDKNCVSKVIKNGITIPL